MLHKQPLQGFHRNPGGCPGRAVTERDFASIGEACLQCRPLLPVDNRDVVAGFCQLIGGGDADNARAKNDTFHAVPNN